MNCGAQFVVPQTCWLKHKLSHSSLRKEKAEIFVVVKKKKSINTDILIAEEMFTNEQQKNAMRFNSFILNHCLYIQVVWLELTEQQHKSAMKYCISH